MKHGSHHIMTKSGFRSVPVPIHGTKDIRIDLLKRMEKQSGVKLI
ncbi:MAG: type II toxin-antitoxin system HicA family toxin [Candidatus Ozemobacteraceae bacterium]